MLHRFRRQAPRIAAVVIVSLATVGGTAAWLHRNDCHDVACVPLVVQHDHSAHQLRAGGVGAEAHAQHCLACHWARAFRPYVEVRFVAAPAAEGGADINPDAFIAWPPGLAAQPSLRSPPASPYA